MPRLLALLLLLLLTACHEAEQLRPAGQYVITLKVNGLPGAVDEHGNILLPFDSGFEDVKPTDYKTSFLAKKGEQWFLISRDGKLVLRANVGDGVAPLSPGLWRTGPSDEGMYGIMDAAGHEVQPPRYSELEYYGYGSYSNHINYRIGKLPWIGRMNAQGKITSPVAHDSSKSDKQSAQVPLEQRSLGWQAGPGGRKLWLLSPEARIDRAGNIWLPRPDMAPDRTVYWQGSKPRRCGYIDSHGQVVIPAQFIQCFSFDEFGAFVETTTQNGRYFGRIDRQGRWLASPEYDLDRGCTPLTSPVGDASRYFAVRVRDKKTGLFDRQTNRLVIEPKYDDLGMLTPRLLVFYPAMEKRERLLLGGGVMDVNGHIVILAGEYDHFQASPDGRFILASSIDARRSSLFDLNGKRLVTSNKGQLTPEAAGNLVFDHEPIGDGRKARWSLRTIYNLQGKTLLTIHTTRCGAEQIRDSAGRPIWPLVVTPYCQQNSAN